MTILVYDPGNPGDWKESVLCCATAAPAAYARVDNVYTAAAVGALPNIDGVPCAVGSRVLLALSPANADNGILEVTSLGSAGTAWTMKRADDCNANANFTAGMMVPIEQGTVNGARVFKLSTTGAIVVNTTPVLFVNAGSLALCTSALDGTVNEFGATDGQILGSDGATAGGVWRNDLNVKPGVVTVTGRLLHGASPATVGEVALSDTDRVTCLTGANSQAVISSSGTTVTVGGAPGAGTTRPVYAKIDSSGESSLRVNDQGAVTASATAVSIGKATISWSAAIASPFIKQADLTTAGASGQTFTQQAQSVTAADALVAGKLLFKGGDSSGAAGTGGDCDMQAGTCAAGTKGTVNLRSAAGTAALTVNGVGNVVCGAPFMLPTYTAAQRDALAALLRMVIWNSDTSKAQVCTVAGTPGTWADLH